ncbi:MAG: ester cyclase [Bryobacteraceae bacterium]
MQGTEEFLACWKGWATALPDSQATFNNAFVSGDTVVLEVTWHGTHKGPLQIPAGPVAATGKTIDIRACQVFQISGGKAQSMRRRARHRLRNHPKRTTGCSTSGRLPIRANW